MCPLISLLYVFGCSVRAGVCVCGTEGCWMEEGWGGVIFTTKSANGAKLLALQVCNAIAAKSTSKKNKKKENKKNRLEKICSHFTLSAFYQLHKFRGLFTPSRQLSGIPRVTVLFHAYLTNRQLIWAALYVNFAKIFQGICTNLATLLTTLVPPRHNLRHNWGIFVSRHFYKYNKHMQTHKDNFNRKTCALISLHFTTKGLRGNWALVSYRWSMSVVTREAASHINSDKIKANIR